ncbi:MAG: leucyl aminopeptidase family protein [Pseudomonadota bacterium]
MEIPYWHLEKIKINQHTSRPTRKLVDARRCLLVLLPKKPGAADWKQLPYATALKSRFQRARRNAADTTQLSTDLPNAAGTHLILQCMDPDSSAFEQLTLARQLAARVRDINPSGLLIDAVGLSAGSGGRSIEHVIAGLLAASCPMPSYKSKTDKPAALKHIDLYGLDEVIDLEPLRAELIGNHLARWLSVLPANELTPGKYRKFVAGLAKREGWQMSFLDTRALKRKKAGAFLAVCQASPANDAGIVHLKYRPKARGGKRLALVGKGICFDTGGVNVKPAKYMNGMHEDMQGSAVALGTLLALSRMAVDFPVDCWLALAENHIGSHAYKPNDVITACNGTTIEVKHTDAEGRMVLADTLALASREKPHTLVDYATLTGACIYSLTSRYSGVFSNRDSMTATLIEAGRDSGERVWPFPFDKDFDEALKSDIADILQCSLEGEADHILAARFLDRFVDASINWVHVDLAASNHKGGLGHIATDTTGFGVRLTLNLLQQQGLMDTKWN